MSESTPRQRPSADPPTERDLASGPLRWLLLLAGFLFVGLAALGVILPLLPTTPFVLVAAACFARSSPRFYNWLLANRVFGPLIADWRTHGSIPRRAKITAVVLIVVVGGSSIWFVVDPVWLQVTIGAILLGVITWLLSRPTSPPAENR